RVALVRVAPPCRPGPTVDTRVVRTRNGSIGSLRANRCIRLNRNNASLFDADPRVPLKLRTRPRRFKIPTWTCARPKPPEKLNRTPHCEVPPHGRPQPE